MPRHPDEDLVAFLDGVTVGGRLLASGSNLFASEPMTGDGFPSKCVFVWAQPGPPPLPYMGSPSLHSSVYFPRLQIRVRGDPAGQVGAIRESKVCAVALRTLIHRAALTGYVSCLILESYPTRLGPGAGGGYEFGLNADVVYNESP